MQPKLDDFHRHTGQIIHETVILASNIHCPSCNTRIREVLLRLDIINVSIILTNGEVVVTHPDKITAEEICQVLSDESYEPYSATTTDERGTVVFDKTYEPGYWSSGGSWRNRFSRKSNKQQATHLENCEACRSGEAQDEKCLTKHDSSCGLDQLTRRVTPMAFGAEKPARGAVTPTPGKRDYADINSTLPYRKMCLNITGMTGASSGIEITQVVENMANVDSVKVDLKSNSAVVYYRDTTDYPSKIQESIVDKGYPAEVTEVKPLSASDDSECLFQTKLSVGGMTCASCSNGITDGLGDLPYVHKVNVTLMTNSAIVVFSDLSNLDRIRDEVEDLGFECSVDSYKNLAQAAESQGPTERAVDIRIDGMFCHNCPSKIVDALDRESGSSIEILRKPDLQNPVIHVQYIPDTPGLTIRSIIDAIESIDPQFHARVYRPPSIEEKSKEMQARERRRLLLRLIGSGIVAIPTLLIGVAWMSLDKSSSASMYMTKPMWGKLSSRSEWALFFFATPVYFWAANIFHTRALKEIKSLWRPGSKTPFLRRFYRFGSMNLLISAGTTVAYVASVALLIMDATGASRNSGSSTYFDSVVFLTFFILIGRFLEAFSKSKTSDAVSMLGQLKPDKAILAYQKVESHRSSDDSYMRSSSTIDAGLLEIGDLVIVPHGSSPPADGIIVAGEGKFDESSLTGESRHILKGPEDEVYTGTISTGDPVTIRVTKVGGSSMLDQIVSVVREGLGKRAPVERYADVLTSYFVPVITAIAIMTWIIWLILGYSGALSEQYLNDQAGGWAFWSLDFAISVFVTACPCGIGLAAPTALFAGIGIAAKLGILVQGGGEAFQEAPHLDAVVFDKTGTLTEGGNVKVAEYSLQCQDELEEGVVWTMARTLEEQSSHPIAKAVVECTTDKISINLKHDFVSEVPGRGICGTFTNPASDQRYEAAIGSQQHMISLREDILATDLAARNTISRWQQQSQSVAIFALRDASVEDSPWEIKAIFATDDPIRPSARPAVLDLQRRGIKVFMLSGDHALTAAAVGTKLGIPEENIFSGIMPTEKAEKIRYLQRTLRSRRTRQGKPSVFSKQRWTRSKTPELESPSDIDVERQLKIEPDSPSTNASVAFVGDGINDAPALLASSLSISLSTGAPVAMTSSSFILLSSDLTLIPRLIDLSTIVYRRIKINFGWALVYNVILVPIAAGILFKVRPEGFRLGPVWASIAMAASSVSVVLSSLALKWEGYWRFRRSIKKESEQ